MLSFVKQIAICEKNLGVFLTQINRCGFLPHAFIIHCATVTQ